MASLLDPRPSVLDEHQESDRKHHSGAKCVTFAFLRVHSPFRARNYSDDTAREIDTAVRSIVEDAFRIALTILEDVRDILDEGARLLLAEESLGEAELEALYRKAAERSYTSVGGGRTLFSNATPTLSHDGCGMKSCHPNRPGTVPGSTALCCSDRSVPDAVD